MAVLYVCSQMMTLRNDYAWTVNDHEMTNRTCGRTRAASRVLCVIRFGWLLALHARVCVQSVCVCVSKPPQPLTLLTAAAGPCLCSAQAAICLWALTAGICVVVVAAGGREIGKAGGVVDSSRISC